MKTIHKYSLNIGDTYIHLPLSAKCLHVDFQNGNLQAWFEVETSEGTEQRQLSVFNTGQSIWDNLSYIGTAVTEDGSFVAHVYELK